MCPIGQRQSTRVTACLPRAERSPHGHITWIPRQIMHPDHWMHAHDPTLCFFVLYSVAHADLFAETASEPMHLFSRA